MFATIIQKWNAFKADWNEYQRLRGIAARAWHKLDRVRARITVFMKDGDVSLRKSCIKTSFVQMSPFGPSDDILAHRPNVVPSNRYCPNFKSKENGENAQPCPETSCPCYSNHCEYVKAAGEYVEAVKKRRSFWGKGRNNKTK